MKPAPAETFRFLTVSLKPVGAPSFVGSSEKLVLCLSHAYGHIAEAQSLQLCKLLGSVVNELYAVSSVYSFCNCLNLLKDGEIVLVAVCEVVLSLTEAYNFLSQGLSALAAFAPDFAESNLDTQLVALGLNILELRLSIGGESVDCDDSGEVIYFCDIFHMAEKIGHTILKSRKVLVSEFVLFGAAMELKRADCGNYDDSVGLEAGHAALDVKELLSTQVCAETASVTT